MPMLPVVNECKHGVRKNVVCSECSAEKAREDRRERRRETVLVESFPHKMRIHEIR